jgi:uncharacterized lipoprotein YajG
MRFLAEGTVGCLVTAEISEMWRRAMVRRVLPVVVAFLLVLAACSAGSDSDPTDETVPAVQAEIPTELAQLALFACNQLRGVAPDAAEPGITSQLTRVASLGYTGQELRDAMRSVCPDVIGPLEEDAELSSLFEG